MTSTRSKRILLVAVLLALAAAAYWAWGQFRLHFPSYQHPMTSLTQHMQPICVGRFIVDVPQQARLQQMAQRISGVEITSLGHQNPAQLLQDWKAKESAWAKSHRPDGLVRLYKTFDAVAKNSTPILVYYPDDEGRMLSVVARAVDPTGTALEFSEKAFDDEDIASALQNLTTLMGNWTARPRTSMPNGPGTCIDGGFLPGRDFRWESVGASFDFPDYPGLYLSVQLNTTNKPDKEGLFGRSDRHLNAILQQFSGVKFDTLRKTSRSIAGVSGDELVDKLYDKKEGDLFTARWEFPGQVTSIRYPAMVLQLTYSASPNQDSKHGHGKALSNDDLLALWDAFSSSLKPRPGAF